MRWRTALALGRVSNLPTVWTNSLAGVVLAGGAIDLRLPLLLLATSAFYVGGMWLNDAFDRAIDAEQRPERPIPSGEVGARTVFGTGFGLLGLGLLLLVWIGFGFAAGTGIWPVLAGLGLAAAIVLYDAWHKSNPVSPLLMGLCRVLVYVTAGLAVVAALPWPLVGGALALLCHLIGLTYVAKQETLDEVGNLWPLLFLMAPPVYGASVGGFDSVSGTLLWLGFVAWLGFALVLLIQRRPGDVPRAVVSLIAGISLLDGLLIAAAGAPGLAWFGPLGFLLTLVLQRWIAGT
ncbi:MAG TPA: UbiA family prenyltransferase [Geminicoccaceae bacterium]